MRSRHYDDWTIERWRVEPRVRPNESDTHEVGANPPLWKDVTLASIIAGILWLTAAMLLT